MKNDDIKFSTDLLIVEALFSNERIIKTADLTGSVSEFIQKVKGYFSSAFKEGDAASSVINMIAPGVLYGLLGGFPILRFLIPLLVRVLGIDVSAILKSIYDAIKGPVSSGQQVTPEQLNSTISQAVAQNTTPVADNQDTPTTDAAQQTKTESIENVLKQVNFSRMIKLAFVTNAGILDFITNLGKGAAQKKGSGLLVSLLGVLFRIILASAGFFAAGKAIQHVLGPSSPSSSASPASPSSALHASTQTEYPKNPNYSEENNNTGDESWFENCSNNQQDVEDMIVDFALEVYPTLKGQENRIKQTPGFKVIVKEILWQNRFAKNARLVTIPKIFTSKKKIVDQFIDDLVTKVK